MIESFGSWWAGRDVVRRRAGSSPRTPCFAAAHRRAAKDRGAGPVGTVAALHEGPQHAWRRRARRTRCSSAATILRCTRQAVAPFWRDALAVGSTPYRACGAYPRDGHSNPRWARSASAASSSSSASASASEPSSGHCVARGPARRAMLVDLPADHVAWACDFVQPTTSGSASLRATLATHDRPRRSDVRAERRVVCAASPERHPEGCAGGIRLRP